MSSTTDAERARETPVSRLDGKTAVVTGASRGIGLATARGLIGAGARVALVARNEDTLREVARPLGEHAVTVACDVTDAAAVAAAAERIRGALGGAPHILVNNAGAFELALVEQMDVASFTATVTTNLVAPFLFAKSFLSEMRARGDGHVVTLGSVADRVVFPENGAYAASKHGVRALHEVMRLELRGSGVRVTLVSPGPVDTPLWDAMDPDSRPDFTPRAAMLSADAVANAVLYAVTQPLSVNIDEVRLSHS
jgi:NADP-dependent 3-hydroxy acid dehydrogenase YdfG